MSEFIICESETIFLKVKVQGCTSGGEKLAARHGGRMSGHIRCELSAIEEVSRVLAGPL